MGKDEVLAEIQGQIPDTQTVEKVQEVREEAEQSVDNFKFDWELSGRQIKLLIGGKYSDLKSLQQDLDVKNGWGVRLVTDVDYDVEFEAETALHIELLRPDED